jgi:sulfite reductase (ferredoxin)
VKLRQLEETLEPLFAAFKAQGMPGECFGDFTARVGFAALRAYAAAYVPEASSRAGSPAPTVGVREIAMLSPV